MACIAARHRLHRITYCSQIPNAECVHRLAAGATKLVDAKTRRFGDVGHSEGFVGNEIKRLG